MKTIIISLFSALYVISSGIIYSQTADEMIDSTIAGYNRKDYKSAVLWGEKAAGMLSKDRCESDTSLVDFFKSLYISWYSLGKYAKAKDYARMDSVLLSKTAGRDNETYFEVINNLGWFYENLNMLAEAEQVYNEALEICKKLFGENSLDYAEIMNNLGVFANRRANYIEAEKFHTKAMELRKELAGVDSRVYASSCNNLGAVYDNMSKYAEAEKYYEVAIKVYEAKNDTLDPEYATYLNNLGSFYRQVGFLDRAEPVTKKALEIRGRILGEKHPYYAQTMNNLAMVYHQQGDFEKADELYRNCIEIFRKSLGEMHPYYIQPRSNYAGFLAEMGRYEDALKIYSELKDKLRAAVGEKHPLYARVLQNMAMLFKNMDRYEESEKYYKESLGAWKASLGERHPEIASTLTNLANLYLIYSKYELAEPLYEEALSIKNEKLGERNLGNTYVLNNLGKLYDETGRPEQAIESIQKAGDIIREYLGEKHEDYSKCISNLAGIYDRLNRMDDARKILNIVFTNRLNYIDKTFLTMSENDKLKFYNIYKNEFEYFNSFAMKYCTQAPELLTEMLYYSVNTKAILLNSTLKVREAIINSRDSMMIEEYESWKSLRDKYAGFMNMGRSSLDSWGINPDSLKEAAEEIERDLSRKSSVFLRTVKRQKTGFEEIRRTLGKDEAAIEIARFRKYGEMKNPRNSEKYIPGLTDTVIYGILIIRADKEAPEVVFLDNGNELENKFYELYRKQIQVQRRKVYDPEIVAQYLGNLYSALWVPIRAKLGNTSRVIICPDGIYNLINLNTLINPETNKYMVEELDIKIVTSLRDVADSTSIPEEAIPGKVADGDKESEGKKPNAVLFGDPVFNLDSSSHKEAFRKFATRNYSQQNVKARSRHPEIALQDIKSDSTLRQGLTPLPGTYREVEQVGDYLAKRGWQVSRNVRKDAIEEAVKAVDNPGVLHIATHGLFSHGIEAADIRGGKKSQQISEEDPMLQSMLLFSGAENTIMGKEGGDQLITAGDDGLLTAFEAMNLNLDRTELVVLSACETGLGEVRHGEGVYGLQRAFRVAGAKTIIMSLWSVSDEATRELMTSFYGKWLSGMTKRDAFRQAQIELKQKFPGFYYWGAFVMVE